MDHHTVATISIAGSSLDVLGSLYLAYDLLGGQNGPLRMLTRAVTYSVVFGIGYGLGLGWIFGVASGVATGVTVAIELTGTARHQRHYSLFWEGVFSAIRGFAFGVGLYHMVGFRFAVAFGVLITVGQIFAYRRGIRPGFDSSAEQRRPRLTRRQATAAIVRTVGYIGAGLACSRFVQHVDQYWHRQHTHNPINRSE